MFREACSKVRKATYGVKGYSHAEAKKVDITNATGFMIAPRMIVTAAHLLHIENDFKKPVHERFDVISAPDVEQKAEEAKLVAEDSTRDIAILRIDDPRLEDCVVLETGIVPVGASCGSLGFPLSEMTFTKSGIMWNLRERFQGANVSAFFSQEDSPGRLLSYYETDSLMYRGSSGCPGFVVNGNVFAMYIRSVVESPGKASGAAKTKKPGQTRLAISIWVPSMDIISFASDNGIQTH